MCNFDTYAEWLLRVREPAYSASWCAEFSVWERAIGVSKVVPYEDDPAWLILPAATKELALKRLEEMLQYEAIEPPSTVQAEQAAAKMSMTTGRFYQLRRRWRESRSIFTFVPFRKTASMSHPRLPKHVSDAVNDHINKAVADGVRSPAAILKSLGEGWNLLEPMPSHMTLRKLISKAVDEAGSISGNITVNNAALPQEAIEKATEFGEVVAVDHTALELFVPKGNTPVRVILSLAIDLHTTAILGYATSFLQPGPEHVLAALANASERSAATSDKSLGPVRPRLIFAATKSTEWRQLVARLDEQGMKASVRHTPRLHFGGMIARLIGPTIGLVKLSSRRAHAMAGPSFDPVRDSWLNPDRLDHLLEDSIRILNEKRVPANLRLRPLDIQLG